METFAVSDGDTPACVGACAGDRLMPVTSRPRSSVSRLLRYCSTSKYVPVETSAIVIDEMPGAEVSGVGFDGVSEVKSTFAVVADADNLRSSPAISAVVGILS